MSFVTGLSDNFGLIFRYSVGNHSIIADLNLYFNDCCISFSHIWVSIFSFGDTTSALVPTLKIKIANNTTGAVRQNINVG